MTDDFATLLLGFCIVLMLYSWCGLLLSIVHYSVPVLLKLVCWWKTRGLECARSRVRITVCRLYYSLCIPFVELEYIPFQECAVCITAFVDHLRLLVLVPCVCSAAFLFLQPCWHYAELCVYCVPMAVDDLDHSEIIWLDNY